MARAQGLLTGGKDMSLVQIMALSIVEREERRERAQAVVDGEVLAIKTALLSANPASASKVFPKYFPPRPEEVEESLEERVQQDEITPEVSQDIERWVAERMGTMSGADLDDDGGWI